MHLCGQDRRPILRSSPFQRNNFAPVATSEEFVKRDRTARLLGVAYLLFQHPHQDGIGGDQGIDGRISGSGGFGGKTQRLEGGHGR